MRGPLFEIEAMADASKRGLKSGMLIRGDERPVLSCFDELERGDKHITFSFPGFKWTQILDRTMVQSMLNPSGPTFMSDRRLYYTDEETVAPLSRQLDPETFPHEISTKVL